jgi:Fe-S cluster biogenesis protein NfuA
MTGGAPTAADVAAAVAELNRALRTHGGAVESLGFAEHTLRLRMTGLCAACLLKPITLQATIRPFVRERLGLEVEMVGARISAEAQARLERAFTTDGG